MTSQQQQSGGSGSGTIKKTTAVHLALPNAKETSHICLIQLKEKLWSTSEIIFAVPMSWVLLERFPGASGGLKTAMVRLPEKTAPPDNLKVLFELKFEAFRVKKRPLLIVENFPCYGLEDDSQTIVNCILDYFRTKLRPALSKSPREAPVTSVTHFELEQKLKKSSEAAQGLQEENYHLKKELDILKMGLKKAQSPRTPPQPIPETTRQKNNPFGGSYPGQALAQREISPPATSSTAPSNLMRCSSMAGPSFQDSLLSMRDLKLAVDEQREYFESFPLWTRIWLALENPVLFSQVKLTVRDRLESTQKEGQYMLFQMELTQLRERSELLLGRLRPRTMFPIAEDDDTCYNLGNNFLVPSQSFHSLNGENAGPNNFIKATVIPFLRRNGLSVKDVYYEKTKNSQMSHQLPANVIKQLQLLFRVIFPHLDEEDFNSYMSECFD